MVRTITKAPSSLHTSCSPCKLRVGFFVLLCLSFFLTPRACAFEPNGFFDPNSGYVRLSLELELTEKDHVFRFALFPDAHVTSLWIVGLERYQIHRSRREALFEVVLNPFSERLVLELTYEGFLSQETLASGILDASSLWFPVSDQDFVVPSLTLTVAEGFHFYAENMEQRRSNVFFFPLETYPIIYFAPSEEALALLLAEVFFLEEAAKEEEEPTKPEDTFDQVSPSLPDEQTIEKEPLRFFRPLGSIAWEDALNTLPKPVKREDPLEDRLYLFEQALLARSKDDLHALLWGELEEKDQLLSFLLQIPHSVTKLRIEVTERIPKEEETSIQARLYTNTFQEFSLQSSWRYHNNTYYLFAFEIRPLLPPLEPELKEILEGYLSHLWELGKEENWAALEDELIMNPDARLATLKFFQKTMPQTSFSIQGVLSQNPLTFELVLEEEKKRYILRLTLHKTGSSFGIQHLSVRPI